MKASIHILFFAAITLLLASCEDRLETTPKQGLNADEAYDTPEKITNILTGAYAQAAQGASYGGQITTISELLANAGALKWNGTFTEFGEINNKNIKTTNSFVSDFWVNQYEISNQVNIVLDHLDLYESEDISNPIKGEAKFLRAVVYYDLVLFFAKHHNNRSNADQPGVPIIKAPVLSLDDITFPTRNTIGEVYNFIINDLIEAVDLLPANNGSFANSNAAKALLARIYLQIGDYELARDYANEVIESGQYKLAETIDDAFNNDDNSTEDIFAWQITDSDGTNLMNTFWATERFGGRPGNPDISVEEQFFEIFDDFNDARGNYLYVDNQTGSEIASYKWLVGNANIPFIRLPEMYLIRAESNFRLDTTIGADPFDDVDVLRYRAGASLLDEVTFSDIILERLREFAFEGHKLHDFKRLELPVGSYTFDDPNLILPIPQNERNVNPNLGQNDGY